MNARVSDASALGDALGFFHWPLEFSDVFYEHDGRAKADAGFVAVIAGWVTTEVGRQPWVIYGLLRTADAASPIATPGVTGSLVAFVIVYFSVFAAGTWYIVRLMAKPPRDNERGPSEGPIRSAGITPAPAKLDGGA